VHDPGGASSDLGAVIEQQIAMERAAEHYRDGRAPGFDVLRHADPITAARPAQSVVGE
jgi:hypothetical protein